jgi:predicted ATPase/class 3 adenylate cyclase
MAELPTGTVTFLFTDLESSTLLWEEHSDAMQEALARHDAILHAAIEDHDGTVFATMGDGVAAAFSTAADALRAVLEAQQRLQAEEWGATGPLRARMGLHTDEGRLRGPDEYVNRPLNRCARLMAIAHGGQVLLSDSTATLVRDALPPEADLVDLGEYQLRDLAARMHVFQVVHPDLRSEFPPLRSLDVLPGNLPRQVTTFVGREEEVSALARLLRERSLVTLTGVGGVGKTRLAVQVGAEVVPEFPDGAWLCELAPVTDPSAIWDALAACLGVKPSAGRTLDQTVLEYLGPKHLLLVLDNCEHLLDPVARMVEVVAQQCPGVTLLATSREGLALAGEQIVAVPSLSVPESGTAPDALSDFDAVRLFLDRAHDAKSEFALTPDNALAVAQLCRRLDGIPLAIELAAARVRSFSPEDLVGRLDQRFRLLTRGSRAALERQQTLGNTIDWSYDLLNDTEREALNRLSVFAGGCSLTAAETVLPGGAIDRLDVPDVLSQLVDKSLLVVDEEDGHVRYRLLETIRQYAQERLEASGDAAAVRRQHAAHFLEVAEGFGPRLRGQDQIACADEAARDTGNFRAALDWAVETESPDDALRLVAPLAVNGTAIGYAAMDWADTAMAVPGAPQHARYPAVASWAAWGATMHGDLDRAAVLAAAAEAADKALGPRDPSACQGPATVAFFTNDLVQARRIAEDWVERARATDDPYDLSHALIMLASAIQLHDHNAAIELLEEAVRIARTSGIASALSIGLSTLGSILPIEASSRALVVLEEAIEVGTKVGDRQAVANAAGTQAALAAQRGEWQVALGATADAAEQQLQLGALVMIDSACAFAAVALAALRDLEPAAVLLGTSEARHDRWGPDWWMDLVASTDAALLEGLGEQQVATLRARGAALTATEAVEYLRAEATRVLGGGDKTHLGR